MIRISVWKIIKKRITHSTLALTFSIFIAHFEHKLGSNASGVGLPATEICHVCGFSSLRNYWAKRFNEVSL